MKKSFIVLFLFLEISIALVILFDKESNYYLINDLSEIPVGEILSDYTINQEFLIQDNNIRKIGIKFATFARVNDTNIKVNIYNGSTFISTHNIYSEEIVDNQYFFFDIPKDEFNINDMMNIEIKSLDGEIGKAVSFWSSSSDVIKGNLYKNGNLVNGDLNIQILKEEYKFEQLNDQLAKLSVAPWKILIVLGILIVSINLFFISLIKKSDR